MFICEPCQKPALSDEGKRYPFIESYGRCEFCGKTAACKDVPSSGDWAWVSKLKTDA